MIKRELIHKYNKAVPRYTSYPPANFFYEDYGADDYRKSLIASNRENPQNISLYIHTPFCPRLCLYCGCNTSITRNKNIIETYMAALQKEIAMVASLLDKSRKVSQIHWGGGTPNALGMDMIKSVMDLIYREFHLSDIPEIAMECSPAYLSKEYLDELFALGFNRISLGIQDFRSDVLKAVNRTGPALPVEEIINYIREKSNAAINLDFIYGLPLQTAAGFSETISKAASLQPERLVTFSYAHVPWFREAQRKLEKYGLPDADAKLKMFEGGYEVMTGRGYVPIGLDHYALPEDDLSKALHQKTLHRNFQGYCTRETTGQVYAFGTSAISQLQSAYAQNTKDVKEYTAKINKGEFAVVKGYQLDQQHIVIREVINEIMCNQYLSLKTISGRLGIDEDMILNSVDQNEKDLKEFESDGLLRIHTDGIEVINEGRFFIRNIAASFDPGLKTQQKNFSKSV